MKQIKLESAAQHNLDKEVLTSLINNLINFTDMQPGSIPIFDPTNGNHLKNGKIVKDDVNGFILYDDQNTQLFRVDPDRRVIIGDGTIIGSLGITKDGLQKLTTSGWVDIKNNIQDSGWLSLTTQKKWVPYGSPYSAPSCRKVGSLVSLRGCLKNGIRTDGTLVFTLPSGFAPPSTIAATVAVNPSARSSSQIIISATGQATIQSMSNNTYFSIDCINFYID